MVVFQMLLDNYYTKQEGGPTAVGGDEIKSRLKKFDSHTKVISKLARGTITYSTTN
jgi:hypothetical protein